MGFAGTDPAQSTDPTVAAAGLNILLHEADAGASRLVRTFRLPACHKDDLRQDLLVDLLGRAAMFNPARGTLGAFAGAVVRHRASRIAHRIRREKRVFVEIPTSTACAMASSAEIDFGEGGGYGHDDSEIRNQISILERRIDLKRALAGLSSTEASLCGQLINFTPAEISKNTGRSRAGIYRSINKIRTHIVRCGVSAAA